MKAAYIFIIIGLIEFCYSCYDYVQPNKCPINTDKPCNCISHGPTNDTVICCNVTTNFFHKGSCAHLFTNSTENLYIYNSVLHYFDAAFTKWYKLKTLTLTNSTVKNITGVFKGSLECINLSSNSLQFIEQNAFLKLPKLELLDLSKNNITKLPKLSAEKANYTLDISGNLQLECPSVNQTIISRNDVIFINRNSTVCRSSQRFDWFNSTIILTLEKIEFLNEIREKCPTGCYCSPLRFQFVPGTPATFSVKVDCSNQNLTELPPTLPPNAMDLDVSNNNITSLDPLISERTYSDIQKLYADNNKITSITSLERSQFIDKLVALSVKNNEIKSIPIYILSHTFDRNGEGIFVKLGGNKLTCDCTSAQVLKLWLLANKVYIPDYDEILCEQDLQSVISLDPNKVCDYQKDWTDYIYYIIAAEVLLLLLLISKVSYDYWVFKTSGYLPWPASKMPKLPCDWVFET